MRDATTKPGPTSETEAPGDDPAEGRPDMNLPGAEHPNPAPDRNDDLPERLGERIENGPGDGIASGEPDLLPNVDVPEGAM
jgi:hypothetical protein